MRKQEEPTQETTTGSNRLILKDGREFELSIDQQFMRIFDNFPKHLDITDLNREITNLTLGMFPSLNEFLRSNPPAESVGEACNFLNTSQVLNLCNDIFFSEELTEATVYTFLKTNNYHLTDVGNENLCWIIKSKI